MLHLPLRPFYPCKLQTGAAGLFQKHLVARDFQLIHCRCECRFNLDSILVAEFVSAAYVSDKDGAIWLKFPDRCIGTAGHPPFADDAGVSATSYHAQ